VSTDDATIRSLTASAAAHISWANTTNRTARTAKARAALDAKFLAQAGGDPLRAEHLRTAYFKQLAVKSAKARRRAAGGQVDAVGGPA
jgi:hypothetical protein